MGFKCVGAFDSWESAVNVYRKNFRSPIHIHDLTDLSHPALHNSKIDVVVAGSPCQGFSTLGKRDIKDPRNQLLFTGAEVAIKNNAPIFVAENVKGAISGKHSVYWERLVSILSKNGYKTQTFLLDAQDFGIPQIRKRAFLIAHKSHKEIVLPIYRGAEKHLGSILEEKPETRNQLRSPSNKEIHIVSSIKQGQKLSNVRASENSVPTWSIPHVFGKVTKKERFILESVRTLRRRNRIRKTGDADPVSVSDLEEFLGFDPSDALMSLISKCYIREISGRYDLTNTFNGKYRRLSLDKPSLTVDTRFGDVRYFVHPNENRGFTVREAARIQSFPDSFKFCGSIEDQFKMIGNAVPPKLGKVVARLCMQALSN